LSTTTTLGRWRLIRRFRLRGVEFPIAEFVKPAKLAGVTNGKVPDELLVTWVDHQSRACRMLPEFRRPWVALVWLAWIDQGRRLTFTSPADVYRDYGRQESGWLRRNTLTHLPGRHSRLCGYPDGVKRRWWLKPFMAGIACPGSSNHGWGGAAVDHTTDKGRRVAWLRWLAVWAPKCGWSWEAPSEDWHIRYCLGDEISATVADIEWCRAKAPLRIGSTGEAVIAWQKVVGAFPDGRFGPKTQASVKGWQRGQRRWYGGVGLPVDGVIDADDWWALRSAA
jgi:hypothetical protein